MSDTKINPTSGIVGTTPTEAQTVVADKTEQKTPGKIAEKPGVAISGGEADGSANAAKKASELSGTSQASPTGSVLGQIAHRTGDAKQYLLVGVNDDSGYLGGDKRDALEALAESNGVELMREAGSIFGTFRVIAVDPTNAQKVSKEINAIDGLFAVRGSKLFDAPAMKGRAPAVADWAARLTDGSLPERVGAARRLLADLRAGKVGKDKTARDAIGDAIHRLLGPTVSLFNNLSQSIRQALTEELRAALPGDDNSIDWNALHGKAGELMMNPANRTAFEPARALAMELLESLDRLETPRSQAMMMELFRHCDYAGFEYMQNNPASAKRLTKRWLGEVDARFTNLKKYLSLSEEERKADDEWRIPSHSGGYENLPNLHRSALDATHGWSADFPVHDFPTDPGLLLSSPIAADVAKGIEKLTLRLDKEIGSLSKKAYEQAFQREYDKRASNARAQGMELTPQVEDFLRTAAEDSLRYDSFANIDGLESLDRILGMIPYHARNSWNCPANQDAIMSKAIDLHTSLLGKVESEGLGRQIINGSLALIGFAKRWGNDMKLSEETLGKLPALAAAIVNYEHDPKAVFMAAYSMGKGKMGEALPILKAGLTNDDPDIRKTSVESIREFGEGAVPAINLLPLLEDENSHWIQAGAAYTLLVVAPEQAEAVNITLRSLLKQEGSHRYWVNGKQHSSARRDAQRTSVIENLGNLGAAALPAAPVLAAQLNDADSDYVRMAASITLLKIGAVEHTSAALAIIEDLTSAGGTIKWVGEDPENRFSNTAVPGSKDKDASFRTQVIQQLNYLGAKGEAALPLLHTLANDADESVAEMANRAIRAIEKKL